MLLPRRTQRLKSINGRILAMLTLLAWHFSWCLAFVGNPSRIHQYALVQSCLQHSTAFQHHQQQKQQHLLHRLNFSSTAESEKEASTDTQRPSHAPDPQIEISRFCHNKDIDSAMRVLEKWVEDEENATSVTIAAVINSFTTILKLLVKERSKTIQIGTFQHASEILDILLDRGAKNSEWLPTAEVFRLLIQGWADNNPPLKSASEQCFSLINKQWSLYRQERQKFLDENEDNNRKILQERAAKLVPLKDSYYHAIRACSLYNQRWSGAKQAAKQAESHMTNMELLSKDYPHLTPDRPIVNEVINAWSKAGVSYKCESLLYRMITMAEDGGRGAMKPDTASFDIVINSLSRGKGRDNGSRAEFLLHKMEALSSTKGWRCVPDQRSFTSVIKSWASSKSLVAAERATAILDHMILRYENGLTIVHPGEETFSVVLKAWSKSGASNAIDRAETVFQQYQQAIVEGKWSLVQYSGTWNSMINCYAKNRLPGATKKARELFETMKSNLGKPGWEECFVDVYTYTTLIDAIAKEESYEASEQAISLLNDVESTYRETGDRRYQPNIPLYGSVVNAIAKSHKEPGRAQAIVDRVESAYLLRTGWAAKPDNVLYNTLINAYGWSDMEGKSQKCFGVLQHMIDLFKSGKIPEAKPDIVSFNSVLNTCAYEKSNSQSASAGIMKIAIEAYETFISDGGRKFGVPDQNTYVQILLAITNHMPIDSEKRSLLAEAVFFHCAENGLVNPHIITILDQVLTKSRFQTVMGESLNKNQHDAGKLVFSPKKMPPEWTSNIPRRQGRRTKDFTAAQPKTSKTYQVINSGISNTSMKVNDETVASDRR